MTYLFMVIGIAVINSLSNKKTSYAEIVLVNMLIISAAMLKEWIIGRIPSEKPTTVKPKLNGDGATKATKYTVHYDRVDRLGNETRQELLDDLQTRTGMNISKVQIKTIDLAQNMATLCVWCTRSEASPAE